MKDYLPAIIALFGTIGATLIAAYFALVRINVNNIVNARIEWLKNLKEYISQFLSLNAIILRKNRELYEWKFVQADPKDGKEAEIDEKAFKYLIEIGDHKNELYRIQALIALNLNYSEKIPSLLEKELNHFIRIVLSFERISNEMLEITYRAMKYLKEGKQVPDELSNAYQSKRNELEPINLNFERVSNRIAHMCRIILKVEWEKAKSGNRKSRSKSQLESMVNIEYLKLVNNE